MIVYKIDPETGRYICPVNVGDMPPGDAAVLSPAYIIDPIPEGMISPIWDGAQWVESWREEPSTEAAPTAPTMEERLAAVEAATLDLILGGKV